MAPSITLSAVETQWRNSVWLLTSDSWCKKVMSHEKRIFRIHVLFPPPPAVSRSVTEDSIKFSATLFFNIYIYLLYKLWSLWQVQTVIVQKVPYVVNFPLFWKYCVLFFIGACSGMTSVDGSVVCPLRADMALGDCSNLSQVMLDFFVLFCVCYVQCVWVFRWCDKHSSRVELSSGAVSLHQPWQKRKWCCLPPLGYLLTACYISYTGSQLHAVYIVQLKSGHWWSMGSCMWINYVNYRKREKCEFAVLYINFEKNKTKMLVFLCILLHHRVSYRVIK